MAEMAVGMRSVQRPRKRALGQRGRVVFHLPHALEPQVANAVEVVVGQVRLGDDLVHQRQAGLEKPIERGEPDDDGVGADVEIEIAADARRRDPPPRAPICPRLPSSSRSAVIDARPWRSGGSTDDPPGTSSTIDTIGTARCVTARTSSPLGSIRLAMRGKRKGRSAAGFGKAAAIDAAHETLTSTAPGSASSRRPRGTTLSVTSGGSSSQRRAAAATPPAVTSR